MRVFVSKASGITMQAMDHCVVEGEDAYFLKVANISLPKREWKEITATQPKY